MERYRRMLVADEALSRQSASLLRRYAAGESFPAPSTVSETIMLLESLLWDPGLDEYLGRRQRFALAAVAALGKPMTRRSLEETAQNSLLVLREIEGAAERFARQRGCYWMSVSRVALLRTADFLSEYGYQVYSQGLRR